MKQFFKFFFASLLALVVAGVLFFIVLFGIIGAVSSSVKSSLEGNSTKNQLVKSNSVLKIDLSNNYLEHDGITPFAIFQGGDVQSIGLHKILDRIKAAKTDNNINGIYLKADGNGSGLATNQQIRSALADFKSSGKFIYAYGDYIPQSAYFVASVADSVFINPLGSVELKGLSSQLVFLKGTLDKLEVKPEIFYCGKFKSATEPFRMDKMSEPNRRQIAALQQTIWQEYLKAFSSHTGVDTATINQWAKTGAIQTANDALAHHLVEGVWYKDQLEDLIRQRTGQGKDDDIRLVTIEQYVATTQIKSGAGKIALLIAQGQIVDQPSNNFGDEPEIAAEEIIKTIRKIKKDDAVKAVVFRVNSPGGSAMASEKILRELNLLKKKKPIVVSMGDLAASGGYYISCQADSIFALPTTITGSIGVFGMMFNTQKFFNNKLGVTFDGVKNAPYADLGNPNRPMTEQEKKFVQNGVDSIYSTFKNRVATGRNKSMSYIDSIGQGRVWSGSAGVQNGLVDALGGLSRAFRSAASLAKIKEYNVEVFPKNKNQLQAFLSFVNGGNMQEKIAAQKLIKSQLGENYQWFQVLRKLQAGKNHVFMLMPFAPEIR